MLHNAFFVFSKQIFCDAALFFNFGINIVIEISKVELEKHFLHKGIELNFQG